ncbi:MAG: hypothetical protein ACRCXD_06880 [Luteolibacter sp.]
MADESRPRLSEAQREEITRRVLAGEKARPLAEEFGVTRAYVSLLKNQALDPERFVKISPLSKKLTPEELERFRQTLATTTPADHGFPSYPRPEEWKLEHGSPLAEKLFGKNPSRRVVKECVSPFIPKRKPFEFTRPQPPKPHHISQISPEFAGDPDYVAYYLSPICEQIAWREYEMALADYEARFAAGEERAKAERDHLSDEAPEDFRVPAPGLRTGKHAKGKGSPFTKPKRRKRR